MFTYSHWHCASKKPNKTQNPIKPQKPTGLGFFLKNRVFLNPGISGLQIHSENKATVLLDISIH